MGANMARIAFLLQFLLFACMAVASDANSNLKTKVIIRPECKWMYYGELDPEKAKKLPDYDLWDPSSAKPIAFKDSRTAISFYVESDGRHLAAIDAKGTLLWVVNPFELGGFCEYRSPHPVIYKIFQDDGSELKDASFKRRGINIGHKFLRITFDSSQFGVIDETTGDFFGIGQN